MLSNYCSNIANVYRTKSSGVNKLVPNLGNKSEYVLHYTNLQLHLSLKKKLSKVYTILKFKRFDWLKIYIDFDTGKSKNAASSFKKNFKLIVNSIYGKMIENLGKMINFRLVSNA